MGIIVGNRSSLAHDRMYPSPASRDTIFTQSGSSSTEQNPSRKEIDQLVEQIHDPAILQRFARLRPSVSSGPHIDSPSPSSNASKTLRQRRPAAASFKPLVTAGPSSRTGASTTPNYSPVGASTTPNYSPPLRVHPVPGSDLLASSALEDLAPDDSEWKKHDPPKELLYIASGVSIPFEIESILEASIETVQNRLVAEFSQQDKGHVAREERNSGEGSSPASSGSGFKSWVRYWQADGDGSSNAEEKTPKIPVIERERQPYSLQPSTNAYSATEGDWRPGHPKHMSAASSSQDSGYISGAVEASPTKSRSFVFRRFLRRAAKGKGKKKATVNGETSSSDSQSMTDSGLKECVSCLEDFEAKKVVPVNCHSYCYPCFHELISNSVTSETYWPPKCCLNEIPTELILLHIKPQLRTRYQKALVERLVPVNERVYCSKRSCESFIPPRNIDRAIACAACPKCRTKTCTTCYAAFHNTSECPSDAALQATLQLAADSGWKRCIGCQAVVEHNEGCLHMTCTCNAQFCYICGSKWRTCACTDVDLANLLASAALRQAQSTAREAQTERERIARERADRQAQIARDEEAEELRQILEEIEAYEAEERARMESEEELRRINAIAARQEREEKRVKEISKHFYNLKNDLEKLHNIQRLTMKERWDLEDTVALQSLTKEYEIARVAAAALKDSTPSMELANMRTRHATEKQIAEWEIQEKLQSGQKALDTRKKSWEDHVAELEKGWLDTARNCTPVNPVSGEVEEADLETTMKLLRKKWKGSEENKDWEKETAWLVGRHSSLRWLCDGRARELKMKQKTELDALAKKEDDEMAEVMMHAEAKRTKVVAVERLSDERWLLEVARVRVEMLREMEVQEVIVDED